MDRVRLLLSCQTFYNEGMKKDLSIKFFIAVIFFCLGFLTNHLLTKLNRNQVQVVNTEERFPVNPDDFDHEKMMETIKRMDDENFGADMRGASTLGIISQRQDDKYVYYDIPLRGDDGTNHKLNVEIKDGMIKITEDIKDEKVGLLETSSERMFSVGPGLDADKAEVINQKEKIVIRIPKK